MKFQKIPEYLVLFVCSVMFILQTSLCIRNYLLFQTVPTKEKVVIKDIILPHFFVCKRNGSPFDFDGADTDMATMVLGIKSPRKPGSKFTG